MGDWINPVKVLPAMFSKKTAFGLNPLNVGGKADPNRAQMTSPGSTELRDQRLAMEKTAAADAKAQADVKAAQDASARQAQAAIDQRKKAILKGSKSVYTSPLGIAGTAALTRKTLLGV